jgi:deoxyribodipyrimidine photolyase
VRARELLSRAKFLDESAAADDKAAVDLQQRLPALRATAKAARERATRATGSDQELLAAVAEDLEAEVVVSEAETVAKRRQAVENRHVARELRAKAVKLVREAPTEPSEATTAKCDPPYRFTADGRKTYLFECLK